jgi:glutaredoxin
MLESLRKWGLAMKNGVVALVLVSIAAAPASAAQLYRWVDAQGRVEWRDTPPPENATQVEQRRVQGNLAPAQPVPYATQQAAKHFPVTLWTANCGSACDKAKSYLARRGIPYTEKDAQADRDALRKATGGLDVPVLVVGRDTVKGYAASTWDIALDAAGYPRPYTAP